jgi:hypothetical protein
MNEVFDVIRSPRFFGGLEVGWSASPAIVIHDFDRAVALAGEEEWEVAWDVANEDKNYLKFNAENYLALSSLLNPLSAELDRLVVMHLPSRCGAAIDDVMSSLNDCLDCRAIVGISNTFCETVLDVYKNGGWPCGWIQGDYPQGHLVIFDPAKADR